MSESSIGRTGILSLPTGDFAATLPGLSARVASGGFNFGRILLSVIGDVHAEDVSAVRCRLSRPP